MTAQNLFVFMIFESVFFNFIYLFFNVPDVQYAAFFAALFTFC